MRTPTSPKGFTEGSSYQKTLSEKDKSITKLELTKNQLSINQIVTLQMAFLNLSSDLSSLNDLVDGERFAPPPQPW